MRWIFTSLAALALVIPGAALAQASGGVQAERLAYGRVVAENWCANCHLVGPQARGPVGDAAPPFVEVARMPSATEMSLRAFLQTPHARMPDYRLSQRELDGVVAYILSLRAR
ncbi:c-type cytochrome [Roseicella aquatilis]|uniref:Cytochrome c n=1 Tax=Roseicella aquatilis TaxID=2527868 RepID=A0A4V2WM59_9PROT|nr:cytochrome c [Roseicella aquatilis]TCZ66590.1 cytochrome c [Roseicella aquatilis]